MQSCVYAKTVEKKKFKNVSLKLLNFNYVCGLFRKFQDVKKYIHTNIYWPIKEGKTSKINQLHCVSNNLNPNEFQPIYLISFLH